MKPLKKGQKAFVLRMDSSALYYVEVGKVERIDQDGTVFIRLPIKGEDNKKDSIVVDANGKDVFASEKEAIAHVATECLRVSRKWSERAFELAARLF